jgi:hypothetical protein
MGMIDELTWKSADRCKHFIAIGYGARQSAMW